MPKINVMPDRTADMVNVFIIHVSQSEYDNCIQHDKEVFGLILLSINEVIQKVMSSEIFLAAAIATFFYHCIDESQKMEINI